MLFLDEGLQHFQVIGFRPGRVVIKRLANVQTLLQHGKRCFELANSCGGRCQICLFLRPLVIKNGKLCLQFRGLIGKEFPLDRDQGRRRSLGRREICQWIAIARALITDPRIVIFDEATSALDYESERIIQENMKEIAKGRTVFIIAHRLSTVRWTDRIITIDRGRLVEDGTHDELVNTGGRYAMLYRLQAGIHGVV